VPENLKTFHRVTCRETWRHCTELHARKLEDISLSYVPGNLKTFHWVTCRETWRHFTELRAGKLEGISPSYVPGNLKTFHRVTFRETWRHFTVKILCALFFPIRTLHNQTSCEHRHLCHISLFTIPTTCLFLCLYHTSNVSCRVTPYIFSNCVVFSSILLLLPS